MAKRPTADDANHGNVARRSARPRPTQRGEYAPFVGYVSWTKDDRFMIAVEATPDDFRDVYKDISAAAEQHSLKLTAFYNANQEAWNVGLTGYLVSSTWPGMCLNVINVDYWRAYRGLHAIHFALLGEDWTNGNESVADTW